MTQSGLPNHVAIILDGNGRWATDRRGLRRTQGHEHGSIAVTRTVFACSERGIKNLTVFGFSVANWSRPKDETDALMRICAEFADGMREEFKRRDIRVVIIGQIDETPAHTRHAMERLAEETKDLGGMTLAIAVSYGARRDIVNALRTIAHHVRDGVVKPEQIDEATLRGSLTTNKMPDPDLVIRTSGEMRLSDFLLFESAYAELFFTDTHWPDFDETVLDEALAAYARRQRRHGGVGAVNGT